VFGLGRRRGGWWLIELWSGAMAVLLGVAAVVRHGLGFNLRGRAVYRESVIRAGYMGCGGIYLVCGVVIATRKRKRAKGNATLS